MSADAHISSSRLRAPVNLSSFSNRYRQRQNGTRINHVNHDNATSSFRGLLDLGNTSIDNPTDLIGSRRMWASNRMQREAYNSILSTHLGSGSSNAQRHLFNEQHQADPFNNDLYEHAGQEVGMPSGSDTWLDTDRYEDWQKPTLDILCPHIHISEEEQLFPIAIAEDGETLPSELHPSHPFGDLHQPALPYSDRFQVLRRPAGMEEASKGKSKKRKRPMDGKELDKFAEEEKSEDEEEEDDDDPDEKESGQSNHLSIALNPPRWPFKRFGPGPGGPNSLLRSEFRKPWRPYRAVWTELDLGSMG